MVVFEIIAEACCWMFFAPAVESVREELKGKSQETKFVSINNNCSIDGCNAMRYEDSRYCLRHVAFPPKAETEQDENWWGGEKE